MSTLSLKEMEKFLWEGREKSLPIWLSEVGRHASFLQKPVVKKCLKTLKLFNSGRQGHLLFIMTARSQKASPHAMRYH